MQYDDGRIIGRTAVFATDGLCHFSGSALDLSFLCRQASQDASAVIREISILQGCKLRPFVFNTDDRYNIFEPGGLFRFTPYLNFIIILNDLPPVGQSGKQRERLHDSTLIFDVSQP